MFLKYKQAVFGGKTRVMLRTSNLVCLIALHRTDFKTVDTKALMVIAFHVKYYSMRLHTIINL